MRLIDADRLKRQVEGRSWRAKEKFIELIDASATIKSQTVQVHFGVEHGRWIDDGLYGDGHPFHVWRCSKCDESVIEIDEPWFKYCPNCGAQMDLKEEKK